MVNIKQDGRFATVAEQLGQLAAHVLCVLGHASNIDKRAAVFFNHGTHAPPQLAALQQIGVFEVATGNPVRWIQPDDLLLRRRDRLKCGLKRAVPDASIRRCHRDARRYKAVDAQQHSAHDAKCGSEIHVQR